MKFSPSRIILGAVGYLLITFPLAYFWHLIAFQETYDQLGYISRDEPIIAFGFMSILLQGLLLAAIYPQLCRGKTVVSGVITFFVVMGGYHWTTHVLAEAAKHQIQPLSIWFPLESTYLTIQFSLGGFWFACVNRENTSQETSTPSSKN